MANDNDVLVVAYYVNEAAALAAAEDLKDWDGANKNIKLGAMAVMTIDEMGKLHADEIGQRNTRSGALWGTALGVGVGILTAGIGLIPGLLMGAAGGAAVGSLSHKDIGMTDEQHSAMVERLKKGGAALAVMCDDFEVEATMAKMLEEGGVSESYHVPQSTTEVMASVAAAQSSATEAVDDTVDAATDEVATVTKVVTVDMPNLDSGSVAAVSTMSAATGLSAAKSAKLHESGISKPSALLKSAATPEGRAEVAAATGMDEADVLLAVKKLDLMRIKGVGTKYATLLIETGVDSVPELATRNAANLAAAMVKTNDAHAVVDSVPSATEVEGWVMQAKALPRLIMY